MANAREKGIDLADDDASDLGHSAGRISSPISGFKHVPSVATLPWKNQYLAAMSGLGVCVVLLALASLSQSLRPFSWLLALASLGSLGFLGWVHLRQQAWLSQAALSETEHVNAAIDALGHHLKAVSAGDLAQQAPQAPGPMGRIGQLIDSTFMAVATQVLEIRQQGKRVEENAIATTTTTNALLEQAQSQATYQEHASARLAQIGEDLAWVAEQSRLINQKSNSALDMSSSSTRAVSGMSDKIDEIRAAAVDAGTRVARLGNFSREISSLVDVLARAADQAGVVALQASLQSEKAGTAGHSFRIVSESMKALAVEIETLARRGSSITTAAASDIEASSHAVEQVVMGSDDVARLMDVASESAHQVMENSKEIDGALTAIASRAGSSAAQAQDLASRPQLPIADARDAGEAVALVASVRELNQKLERWRS